MRWEGKGAAMAVLLIALLCYALCVILARVVYQHGGDALAVLISRMGVFFFFLWIYFVISGRSLALPRRELRGSLLVGAVVAVQSYAYYSSFQYLPVSLAALIFYLYPTLVALGSRLVARTPLTSALVAALLAAFMGLALVLQASVEGLETHGLLRAFTAAIGMTTTVLLASRLLARIDTQVMTFYSSGVTSAVYVLAAFIVGAATPADFAGWAALIAMPLIYTVGVLGWYSSMPRLGTVRVAFISNFEPLFTGILAARLLDVALSPRQILGGALVIGAVLGLQLANRRTGG